MDISRLQAVVIKFLTNIKK